MAALALADQKERQIEVNRERLLVTLKANREKHIKDYKEAVEGYCASALKKLEAGYEKAKLKVERNYKTAVDQIKQFDVNNPRASSDWLTLVEGERVELKVPRNFSKEYDAAIDMVTWDVRETLELTHAEFQCFVRDVWDWSNDFVAVTAAYKLAK